MDFVRCVILNYNQSHLTLNTIQGVLNQLYLNYEIVVVDNASNAEEILILQKGLPKSVKSVYSKDNLGYAKGNNLGCKYGTNHNEIDYYLILNNDLIIEDNDFIRKMLDLFDKNDSSIVAMSPLVNTLASGIDLDKQIQVRRILSPIKHLIVTSALLSRFFISLTNYYLYKTDMPYKGKCITSDTINGAVFMIKARFFKSINFFDESTFLYNEEIILGKKICDLGYKCLLNGFVTVDHLQGYSTNSNKSSFNLKMEKYKISSSYYYFKHIHSCGKFFLFCFLLIRKFELFLKKIRG